MDPVSSCSFPTSGSSDNPARKQSTDLDVQTGCPQSEDTDAFESGIQLTSAGFDPAQPSAIHTYVSDFTHPLTVKSLQQLDSEFGCIPLGDFKLYTGPPVVWHSVPDIIQAHNLIRASGVPIFWVREYQSRVILISPVGGNIYVIILISSWLTSSSMDSLWTLTVS